ncbi:MAG: hypothetical protein P8127_15660 [Acidobacteriota bacterium]
MRREAIVDERSLDSFYPVLATVGDNPYDRLLAVLIEGELGLEVIGDAVLHGQVWDATQDGRAAVAAIIGDGGPTAGYCSPLAQWTVGGRAAGASQR